MRRFQAIVAFAVLLATVISGYGYTVTAQVAGNQYTSPQYGYTITWQPPWYVIDEGTDSGGYDTLELANDESNLYFSGGRSNGGSPAEILGDFSSELSGSSDFANLQQLDASLCPVPVDANSAAVCYRADQTYDDGTQSGIGIILKSWDLGDGVDLLLQMFVDEAALPASAAAVGQFGVYAAGQPVPASAGSCDLIEQNGATFCFDPSLPAGERGDVIEATRFGQDAIERYFGGPELDDVRITEFGSAATGGDQSLATTVDESIVIYGGSDVWQSISPIERTQTVVHELFHIYQNLMTGDNTTPIPLWFSEGTAEAVGFQAISELGITDQSEIYDLNLNTLTLYPGGPLADLDKVDSISADSYPLAYMAVQYLLASHGMSVSALGTLYGELQKGSTFEQAFETVFGETVDQFYTEFEAWRPSLEAVQELPDDFWGNQGDAPPAQVTVQQAPATAAPNQQILVVAQTEPLTDCDAALPIGNTTISRETFSNGEGELFWLITIPVDAPAGPVTLTLSCDANPATVAIEVS